MARSCPPPEPVPQFVPVAVSLPFESYCAHPAPCPICQIVPIEASVEEERGFWSEVQRGL
jgi:hypothetical protein